MLKLNKKFCDLGGVGLFRPAAWIRVSGEDALSFLQGQLTQELREGRSPAVNYGLWLTQKGKVLADSWVIRISAEECWIWSGWSAAAVIRERLEAFIIADDVELEDHTQTVEGRIVAGPAGREVLVKAGITPPDGGEVVHGEFGWVFRTRRGVEDAWEWVRPHGSQANEEPGPAWTAEDWERARLLAGIPRVPEDLGGEDLPNEGGIEAAAISYSKGCYLGQEVVARLKALGRVRRRLVVVGGEGEVPTASPLPLSAGGGAAGELRSRVARSEGGWLGMAMVRTAVLDAAAGKEVVWEDPDGNPVHQVELA